MMKLYGFSRVNSLACGLTRDLRVLWALEKLELPFELVGLDHPAGELNTPAYRHLSPFMQIPVLEDGSVVLSESGAILIYLAKKAGKLIPLDAAGEAQVIRWCFAALDTVELATLNIFLIDGGFGTDPRHPFTALRAQWVNVAHRFLESLEQWLEDRTFITEEAFTVADILMALVLDELKDEQILVPYARVRAYRDRCMARPAWQRVLARYHAHVIED
jgi:glutathione S-transferase